jgi:hypothetical protein
MIEHMVRKEVLVQLDDDLVMRSTPSLLVWAPAAPT